MNSLKKSKFLLGKEVPIELQKVDKIWRLIEESKYAKKLTEQEVFKLMFRYKYLRQGNKCFRLDMDRGSAEHLARNSACILVERLNEFTYDPQKDRHPFLRYMSLSALAALIFHYAYMWLVEIPIAINGANAGVIEKVTVGGRIVEFAHLFASESLLVLMAKPYVEILFSVGIMLVINRINNFINI